MKPYIHYNIEMERAVLGACLLEKTAVGRTFGAIVPENLYHEGHRMVYATMKSMYEVGLPIDLETVADKIIRQQGIGMIGQDNTAFFLTQLTNSVCSSAHLEYHCYILRTLWMEREIYLLTNSGSGSLEGDVFAKVSALQKQLQELNRSASSYDWEDMTTLMVKLYQHQEEIKKTGGMGLRSGFNSLDRVNGGFHSGQMIVLAARPSVGKSAIAGQIAVNVAKNGKKVGIVSLEMSNTEIAARLAAIDTDTEFHVLYRALYRDEQQAQKVYEKIARSTSELPIFVTDKTNVNINDIRAKAEKLKHREGIDLLIVDYLQLIETGNSKNREQEVAQLSRGCKIMAKEMGIPVIVVAQLNREAAKRKGDDKFPQLSDLRESGAIEQDADAVIFLHRDWMHGIQQDENGNSTEKQAHLVVRKWRNGANNFNIELDFEPTKMLFRERGGHLIPLTPEKDSEDAPF